jgi:SAM-dependent methyltransferase
MSLREQMETIYRDMSPDDIPWNMVEPPDLLVELVTSGWVEPCPTVDLGCGAGNQAVWLATLGFEVTGIDLSSRAIQLAENAARSRDVHCRFLVRSLLELFETSEHAYDFAYDWEVLHHIFPEEREAYADNVRRILNPGGKYFSVCFSEEDMGFGSGEKLRETPLGTTLYFSSEEELHDLFRPRFEIEALYTTDIEGKFGSHRAVVARMIRP